MSINTKNAALRQFAQATGVPSSGASNADDFQPPTRNPQQAPGGLQQGGQLSETGGSQDILTDNPNARIVVPVNPADPEPQTLGQTSDAGWGIWWIILAAAIVAAVAFAWRQSYKNKRDYGMKVQKVTNAEVKNEVALEEKPKPAKAKSTPKTQDAKTVAKPKKKKTATKKKSRKQRRKS